MKQDYLRQLHDLGLIARLKRVSDDMLYSIRDLYKQYGFDIEPNWHFVFLLLKEEKTSTMSEMAEAFGLSQPAVVKIINKMKQRGYIADKSDETDSRKKRLSLTRKGQAALPKFEKVWEGGQNSIKELLKDADAFYAQLDHLEDELSKKSFKERVLTKVDKP